MADYIDREQVIENFRSRCVFGRQDCIKVCHDVRHIKAIPAADVKPVVRGEWIIRRGNWTDEYECSLCHKVSKTIGNFCPNCGARMVNNG